MPIIDHIGIALKEFGDTAKILKMLGLESYDPEDVADQKVNTWSFQAGPSEIELLSPSADDSPIAKYLENKGAGIHHLAVRVKDIRQEIAKITEAGIRMIDETPRVGAGGKLIAFIHPKYTGGILIELTQQKTKNQ